MNKYSLEDKIKQFRPDKSDPDGQNKCHFLDFMMRNCVGVKNALSESNIVARLQLQGINSKEEFQHRILVPLRRKEEFFIGTSNRGIYLVLDSEDAYKTIEFYSSRIWAERNNLRNLKRIVKKYKLLSGYKATFKPNRKRYLYMDESGTPTLADKSTTPYFIISAIIADSRNPESELSRKFIYIRECLRKPPNFEFKSNRLNKKEYEFTLKELSTLDYQYATIYFDKLRLTGEGFDHAKSFYKYAVSLLLDNILEHIGQACLFLDMYGGEFGKELKSYLYKRDFAYPENKIEQIEMFESGRNSFIQLADLIAGVIKNSSQGKYNLLPYIEDNLIECITFPYRRQ